MSEAAVVRISLTEARAPSSGFMPRIVGGTSAPQTVVEIPPEPDQFARGYDEGYRLAQTEFAAERDMMVRLIASAEALQPEPSEELAAMITTTVERLVSELVGSAPVDADWLRGRIDTALACIADADAARTLWLHPEDLDLLGDCELPLEIHADPSLERGALRIDCSVGWVEDSRSLHLDALRAALGTEPRT